MCSRAVVGGVLAAALGAMCCTGGEELTENLKNACGHTPLVLFARLGEYFRSTSLLSLTQAVLFLFLETA